MKPRLFLAFLLAGAIGNLALVAEGPAHQSSSVDLNQLRLLALENRERFEDALQGSCKKMLTMQTALHNRTRDLHQAIESTGGKKSRPEDQQAFRKLTASEKSIVIEASRAIEALEADGA